MLKHGVFMNNFWYQLQKVETKVEMAGCTRCDLLIFLNC